MGRYNFKHDADSNILKYSEALPGESPQPRTAGEQADKGLYASQRGAASGAQRTDGVELRDDLSDGSCVVNIVM